MPTISFSFKDFQNLLGKKISETQLSDLFSFAKAELEEISGDNVSVKFNDTNLPYLWSVEGLARFCRGVLKLEKGIPRIKVIKSNYKLSVDKKLKDVRPFISAFVVKGKKLDDYLLKQLIHLQEKLADNFGRRRQKIAIGLYPAKKIQFPLSYTAVQPNSVKFIPLDDKRERSLREILETHPKGKEYSWILKPYYMYPVIVDNSNQVLSFPPIINSEKIGKLSVGDDELFFEATGTDENAVMLVCIIFAYAFADRGFSIYDVGIQYDKKTVRSPSLSEEKIRISKQDVKNVVGIELSDSEIKDLLERSRYALSANVVTIPPFRQDVMHVHDVVEDVAIMYGYNNFESAPLTSYTVGSTFKITNFVNVLRKVVVGAGYQEVFSAILANSFDLYDKMNVKDFGTVEISEYMSESYSVVRTWVLPNLMDVLSKNKHVDFPQRVFEHGLVALKSGQNVLDKEKLAVVSSHSEASFTEMKQLLNHLFGSLGVDYSLDDFEHSSFIIGRCAKILVKNKLVGFVGELHPQVLSHWRLEMPVSAIELDVTDLFNVLH